MSSPMHYDHMLIETKWQKYWEENNTHSCSIDHTKQKYYVLEMWPYPSGKIHMGHVRNYSIGDVIARLKKMQGYNVLHPIGWDAFGLPAEQAAIKHATQPAQWTYANIEEMRKQLQRLGYSYDWERELTTCTPNYYRWEQLFFIRWLEKGLVYKKKSPQNWCVECNTVLANEQVINGLCWRCDSQVIQKELTQWFLKITAYAEELLDDLAELENSWPDRVITMQKNWIGKSSGVTISFPLQSETETISIFTTRADTLFGVTFVTIAPDHPLVPTLLSRSHNCQSLMEQVERLKNINSSQHNRDIKEGIFTESYCIHPITEEKIPIWISNFVLAQYGTGAVMGVPAHDQRDFEFSQKYGLPIRTVIQDPQTKEHLQCTKAYDGEGILINSGSLNGLPSTKAKQHIIQNLEKSGMGKETVALKLRDWNISRQRYWGTPIPIIYCATCGTVPVPENQLPVILPADSILQKDGHSPLPNDDRFIQCTCPQCHSPAKRETDTMDTFVDSSWYFARYTDPSNEKEPFALDALEYWLNVDQYIGGVEHAVLHLLYARFFTKMLRDLGYFPKTIKEPFQKLLTQGMVLKDGFKMSKSKGNTVDPVEMITTYGADTVRLFCLFAAPPERDFDWSDKGIEGSYRFLHRVWRLFIDVAPYLKPIHACQSKAEDALTDIAKEIRRKEHLTVQKVHTDIENKYQFNTAIAAIMEFVNALYLSKDALVHTEQDKTILSSSIATVITLLAPITPHICEELWMHLGHSTQLTSEPWPKWDSSALETEMATIVIQINGKLRERIEVQKQSSKEDLKNQVLASAVIQKHLQGKHLKNIIIVPEKLVNLVTE